MAGEAKKQRDIETIFGTLTEDLTPEDTTPEATPEETLQEVGATDTTEVKEQEEIPVEKQGTTEEINEEVNTEKQVDEPKEATIEDDEIAAALAELNDNDLEAISEKTEELKEAVDSGNTEKIGKLTAELEEQTEKAKQSEDRAAAKIEALRNRILELETGAAQEEANSVINGPLLDALNSDSTLKLAVSQMGQGNKESAVDTMLTYLTNATGIDYRNLAQQEIEATNSIPSASSGGGTKRTAAQSKDDEVLMKHGIM